MEVNSYTDHAKPCRLRFYLADVKRQRHKFMLPLPYELEEPRCPLFSLYLRDCCCNSRKTWYDKREGIVDGIDRFKRTGSTYSVWFGAVGFALGQIGQGVSTVLNHVLYEVF